MAEASVPVDLFNPGQVFACLGFVEAADVLLGDVEGAFDWSEPGNTRFRLRARGEVSPIECVLEFLDHASAVAIAPEGSAALADWKSSWGEVESVPRERGYPFSEPRKPIEFAFVLRRGTQEIAIDHWGDASGRDNVKFWIEHGGNPGIAVARDALSLIAGRAVAAAADPFSLALPQSSSFRLDWRRDYIPIGAGFSLNAHGGKVATVGFPLVELLGAIGLTHARPSRPERRNRLQYRYGIAGRARPGERHWLPASILRAALGAAPLPFPMRRFRMFLDWPGQEVYARAISTVTEETNV